jgi:hypothetical protein
MPQWECSADGLPSVKIEAESPEGAARNFAAFHVPGPADKDISIRVSDGETQRRFNATIEYDADVWLDDDSEDDDGE